MISRDIVRTATVLVSCALLATACRQESEPARTAGSRLAPFAEIESLGEVTIHDPGRSVDGVNLVFYRQRIPVLMDNDGRIVHAWPTLRTMSRLRLLPDGGLLALGAGRSVLEVDWEGRLRWQRRFDETLPHHDVIRLTNGNTLLLTRLRGSATDDLMELDGAGNTVWTWRSADHLEGEFHRRTGGRGDITHLNSVQEIPDNPWFRAGDSRFRPGNLLLSARNLNVVLLVDRRTGELLWTYDDRLDLQHEALMIGPGLPGSGRILIFDNGYRGRFRHRRSEIREIDPRDRSTTWSWSDGSFFSPTSGVQQPLPGGNILVTSTRGGRVFELDRSGEIVWQWIPPSDPVRTARYPWTHCPQLAELGPRPRHRVEPEADAEWVDPPAYRFARRADLEGRRGKSTRRLLASNHHCADLHLPARPLLELTFGVLPPGRRPERVRRGAVAFAAWIESPSAPRPFDLLREVLGPGPPRAATRSISLEPWGPGPVRLCVDAELVGHDPDKPTRGIAWWEAPVIRDAARPTSPAAGEAATPEAAALTEDEREAQLEHLRVLGYVD